MELNNRQIRTKTRIELFAKLFGINPSWAVSVAMVESSLGDFQKSPTGARGTFQMTSIAMKDLLWAMERYDDDLIDIVCGIAFLRLLLNRHESIEEATLHYCDPNDRYFYYDKVKAYMKEFENEKV